MMKAKLEAKLSKNSSNGDGLLLNYFQDEQKIMKVGYSEFGQIM